MAAPAAVSAAAKLSFQDPPKGPSIPTTSVSVGLRLLLFFIFFTFPVRTLPTLLRLLSTDNFALERLQY